MYLRINLEQLDYPQLSRRAGTRHKKQLEITQALHLHEKGGTAQVDGTLPTNDLLFHPTLLHLRSITRFDKT